MSTEVSLLTLGESGIEAPAFRLGRDPEDDLVQSPHFAHDGTEVQRG